MRVSGIGAAGWVGTPATRRSDICTHGTVRPAAAAMSRYRSPSSTASRIRVSDSPISAVELRSALRRSQRPCRGWRAAGRSCISGSRAGTTATGVRRLAAASWRASWRAWRGVPFGRGGGQDHGFSPRRGTTKVTPGNFAVASVLASCIVRGQRLEGMEVDDAALTDSGAQSGQRAVFVDHGAADGRVGLGLGHARSIPLDTILATWRLYGPALESVAPPGPIEGRTPERGDPVAAPVTQVAPDQCARPPGPATAVWTYCPVVHAVPGVAEIAGRGGDQRRHISRRGRT